MLVGFKMATEQPTKLKCTYCTDDVYGIAIKCVECVDFDLCLQCFSAGAEIGPHKNDHPYKFIDSGTTNINHGKKKWSSREHLELLYQIQCFGFGNWEEILPFIKPRTAEEAHDEYIAKFVDGSLGRALWPAAYEKRAQLPDLYKDDPPPPTHQVNFPPIDVTPEEAALLGYMPNRDDFDQEYDNEEAESLLSSLYLLNNTSEDDELYISLKLAQVDMYIDKLRERSRRKKICRDYQLIKKFFTAQKERLKLTKIPEQEFDEKYRWMCQLQTAKEHDCLLKNLLRQKELQHRLSELIKYRKNGLTKIEELPHFEQELQAKKGASGSSMQHYLTATLKKKKEKSEVKESCSTEKNYTSHTVNHGSLQGQERRQILGDFHPLLSEPSKHLLNKTEAQVTSNSTRSFTDDGVNARRF
ncbi:transcriptional adapter 2B isoform X3 [Cimex lectularius]|uniref:Transcriptional adapter n=1 Tax=Cimex lectularius TaxID=79782 RepID=A0A8I6RLN8_CIMLE|nr:transcriptional adapter 2B isoform X3 [Cimex lectularius]